MGAAARQRGDKLIREQLSSDEIVSVRRSFLSYMESDLLQLELAIQELQGVVESKDRDLHRARSLIDRLRTENQVLKAEKKRLFGVVDATKKHLSVAYNPQKKWAVAFVKAQLEKAKLI